MFAIALWDGAKRRMLLARDPYGIKPLYYADDGGTMRVASQVQGAHRRRPGRQAVRSRRGGRLLPARHRARAVHDVSRHPRTAGGIVSRASTRTASQEPVHTSRSPRRCATRSKRDAAFTTASAQSSCTTRCSNRCATTWSPTCRSARSSPPASTPRAVVALARETGAADLQTMTLRFEEYRGRDNDEAPLAALVAQQYGVRHTIRELTLRRFPRRAAAHFRRHGSADRRWPEQLLHQQGRAELGLKVAMSGAGGDELFGGYTSFRDIPRWMPVTSVLSRVPGLGERRPSPQHRAGEAQPPHQPEDGRDRPPRRVATPARISSNADAFWPPSCPRSWATTSHAKGWRASTCSPSSSARSPRSRQRLRARGGARVVALSAQSTAARHGLGQHGPLARSARPAGRRAPASQARPGAGDPQATRQSNPRQRATPAPPRRSPQRRKTGFTLPINEWLQQEGRVEFGKRSWARKVYEVMFGDSFGYW